MAKKKKQFCPFIYSDWGELFEAISVEQRAELLLAITKFPEYEPKDVPIWNFIKSQLNKDYQNFVEKCEKNSEISQSYWERVRSNESERIPNESERHPKLKPLTKTKTKTKKENKKEKEEIKIPTLEEIENYCKERNNNVDPKRFFDYYDTANWKDKDGKQIKNWKQKMIAVWEAKNPKRAAPPTPKPYNPYYNAEADNIRMYQQYYNEVANGYSYG